MMSHKSLIAFQKHDGHTYIYIYTYIYICRKLLYRNYFANAMEGPLKQGMAVELSPTFDCLIVAVGFQLSYLCLTVFHWPVQLVCHRFKQWHTCVNPNQ